MNKGTHFISTSDDPKAVLKMIANRQVRRKNKETDVLFVIKGKTGHRTSEL